MTKTVVPTIDPTASVPTEHLSTTFGALGGTYWLYGFHAHDTTARFTLVHDGWRNGDGTDVILDSVPWPTAYKALVERDINVPSIEAILRSVLPNR